jgi:hypothetical protein
MLARSPNQKRATEYLLASGAVPITIIERDKSDGADTFSISIGKITGAIAARWWIAEQDAAPVARKARRLAGADPDLSTATAVVARSAAVLRAVLTPDDVAVTRAGAAVVKLDAMVETMRRNGQLQEFNTRYKRGRAAALAKGRGFMDYGAAMARLKTALIPYLMQQSTGPMASIFAQVFR